MIKNLVPNDGWNDFNLLVKFYKGSYVNTLIIYVRLMENVYIFKQLIKTVNETDIILCNIDLFKYRKHVL